MLSREQIRGAKAGDQQALEEMAEWLADELLAFLYPRFGTQMLGDLVQETFKDILAKLPTHAPEEPEAFHAWAMSFAGMEARGVREDERREAIRRAKLKKRLMTPLPSGESIMLREERWELLLRHMLRLPRVYRDALEHRLRGGEYRVLAEREGITEEAARTRYYRARRLLKLSIQRSRVTRSEHRTPP